jgi:hypothetical protein
LKLITLYRNAFALGLSLSLCGAQAQTLEQLKQDGAKPGEVLTYGSRLYGISAWITPPMRPHSR